ncbi:MAG: glucarate dehydratase [Candidatus Atribacteria bacterium]|nr:glucarate dehydratase [Candidatus Atribacteria bacterium]
MKITNIDIIPVAFKEPPLRNSTGVHEEYAVRNLVKLTSECGAVGYGETLGGTEVYSGLEHFKKVLLGQDPANIERAKLLMHGAAPNVFSAYEVAMLDLTGKILGISVSELLGGRVRDEVTVSGYLFYHYADENYNENLSTESMVKEAKYWFDKHGFTTLKVKGGVLEPAEEIETIRGLRAAFPEAKLRLDPNQIWSLTTAVQVGRALADDLEYLEDPVNGIEGMARLRQLIRLPLATNMCVTEFDHIPASVRANAVDVILLDHHHWGGLWASKHLAVICNTLGLDVSMHSNSHLDISMAAMLHLAATIPNLIYASDTHYIWVNESDSLLSTGKLQIKDGKMDVPTSPGLGIDIDGEKVATLHANFEQHPIESRDDITEMRQRNCSWLPIKPRW